MERPMERRAAARTGVVWDALQGLALDERARVLDIGGGTGGLAVRLAGLGHHVTVVDPSPDALAAAARRADEAGVADLVTGIQGDLGDLAGLPDLTGLDLVLCHGVLGLVEDPAAALATLASALRSGGHLSLLVGQRHAAVLARAMAGHFTQAKDLLGADPGTYSGTPLSEHRFTAPELTDLLSGAGMRITAIHGIRVFSDLVPSTLLDLEPGAAAALLDLERAVAARPEYLTLAAQLHALATT